MWAAIAAVATVAAMAVVEAPAARAAPEAGAAPAKRIGQPRYEAPERPLPASPAVASAISGFQGSKLDKALELQYQLGGDVGLRDAPWIGTHNSYNSVAEMGQTISTSDANQQLSINDQLDLDIRSIELDLHWFQSPSSGQFEPVVCHAFPNHFPCSTEKSLGPVLDEVNAWLRAPANSDQVLFVFLEDHLDNHSGYDTAAGILQQKLGDILYAPTAMGPGCQLLPLKLTRDQMLKAGKRVILVGNTPCGIGSAWPAAVFNWDAHVETQPGNFSDYPKCGTDFTRAQYNSTQVRYYEDGRPSQIGGPRITPDVAGGMARCGVDLLGLDQLAASDSRLSALVWSWAGGQPKAGKCAVQGVKKSKLRTRWKTLGCARHRRPACRKGKRWLLGTDEVAQRKGRGECKSRHAKFAVPRTGFEAQLLRKKQLAAGERQVWLGYVKRHGDWVALDKRGP